MTQDVSLEEIGSLFKGEPIKHPRIGDAPRKCLGKAAEVIDTVGLPIRFADSYQAVDEVSFFSVPENCSFSFEQRPTSVHRAVEIGRSEFGTYVVDCDSGCVVYIDSSGSTQLINTSVERFLFFVGRFTLSAMRRFSDSDELLADCKRVDEAALSDPEGMWSVMIEEARAGLY